MDIRYSYNETPTIREFALSNAFFRALTGPVGGGKSSGCTVEFPRRAQMQKPGPDGIKRTRWAVIRGSYPMLRDTTIKTFHQWLPPEHFGRYYEAQHRYVVKAFPGCEFEVLFRALDKPDDIRNLLSLDLTGAWINEMRETPWAVVDALQGRLGRYPSAKDGGPTWFGLWGDTNMPDIDSEFYAYFEDGKWKPSFEAMRRDGILPKSMKPEDFAAIFKQPSGMSPEAENIKNLPAGYYHRLAIGKSQEWINVYIHGKYGFVSNDKAVYPEFSERLHVQELNPIPGRPIIRGMDFGLTPACTLSQILPDGRWLVFDEIIATGMGIDRFSDQVLEHCSRAFKGQVEFEDYGDPAGQQRAQTDERTCFEILQAKGINIEPGLQTLAIRLESVRKPLRSIVNGEPQFVLHPRCKQLRKGFLGGYHFRRMATNSERYTDQPEKNSYSHCFPAGTLVSTPTRAVPIETLAVGDIVCTPLGERPVLATMNRETRHLWCLTLSDGRAIRCTPDHELALANGRVSRADTLRYGDTLRSLPCEPNIQSKSSWASATTADQMDITQRSQAAKLSTCTAQSGSTTTDQSRRNTPSITTTTTRRTIVSRIWSYTASAITRGFTVMNTTPKTQKLFARTWRQFVRRLLNGTGLRLVGNGTGSMEARSQPSWKSSLPSVFGAGAPIALSAAQGSAVIAPHLAKALLAEHLERTTKPVNARSAKRSSFPIDIHGRERAACVVRSICDERQSPVMVYDLTVEDAHCFYAEGVLVSNCHDALQYPATILFGGGLTGDRPYDDYPQAPPSDQGRSDVTGY